MRWLLLPLLLWTHPLAAQEPQYQGPRDTVFAYLQCYARVMGFSDPWTFAITFHDTLPTNPDSVWWAAATEVDLDYYHVEMEFWLPFIAQRGDVDRRRLVVHELAHVWIWELGELAEVADYQRAQRPQEQLATRIEHWLPWLATCPVR